MNSLYIIGTDKKLRYHQPLSEFDVHTDSEGEFYTVRLPWPVTISQPLSPLLSTVVSSACVDTLSIRKSEGIQFVCELEDGSVVVIGPTNVQDTLSIDREEVDLQFALETLWATLFSDVPPDQIVSKLTDWALADPEFSHKLNSKVVK